MLAIQQCVGPSMLPTINQSGDVVLLDCMTPRWGTLQKGDVVIAHSPTDPNGSICKRVRALAGDTITIPAMYTISIACLQFIDNTVPEGHMWLEGDNSSNSTDSRVYGAVPQAMLKGRVWLKLWPLTEFGRIGRTRPIEQSQSTIQRAVPVIEVLQPMQEQAVTVNVTSNSETPQHEAVTVQVIAPTVASAVRAERNSTAENGTSSSKSSSSSTSCRIQTLARVQMRSNSDHLVAQATYTVHVQLHCSSYMSHYSEHFTAITILGVAHVNEV
eukprot:19293-Heterococcus_DN1.PRE.6